MMRKTEHFDNAITPCKDEPHCSPAQAAFVIDLRTAVQKSATVAAG